MQNKNYQNSGEFQNFENSPFDESFENSNEPTETPINTGGNYYTEEYKANQSGNKASKEFDEVMVTVKNIDATLAERMTRNRSFIEKYFPNKMDRLLMNKELAIAGSAMDFRHGLVKIASQFRTLALKEKYETHLHVFQTQNRLEKAKYQMSAMNQLMSSSRIAEEKGLNELTEMYTLAAKQTVPQIKIKYMARIEQREDAYFNYQSKLMHDFERVIHEGININ